MSGPRIAADAREGPTRTRPEGWEHPDNLMWEFERKLGMLFATADFIACHEGHTSAFLTDPPMTVETALHICGLRDDWKALRSACATRVSELFPPVKAGE